MNLIKCIIGLFRRRENKQQSGEPANLNHAQNRALVWLGKDRLERQLFYEKWAGQESWQVLQQGLPLLLGRDPEDPELSHDADFINQKSELWEHLKRCVNRGVSPSILNPAEDPESWQAEPVELYRWAVAARLAVPEELDALLSFISSTIKPSQMVEYNQMDASGIQDDSSTENIAREQVLSAMLALVLQKVYQNSTPDISELREDILASIYSKSQNFFNQEEPPLSRPVLHDLLDRSLETAGLIRI